MEQILQIVDILDRKRIIQAQLLAGGSQLLLRCPGSGPLGGRIGRDHAGDEEGNGDNAQQDQKAAHQALKNVFSHRQFSQDNLIRHRHKALSL